MDSNDTVFTYSPTKLVQEAFREGVNSANGLLLKQCYEAAVEIHAPGYKRIYEAWQKAQEISDLGQQLQWLDRPLEPDQLSGREHVRVAKLRVTLSWARQLREGTMFMTYVEIPAYNDLQELQCSFAKILKTRAESPLAVVVADNNSADSTASYVRSVGGNIVPAPVQGIGPARQAARDAILKYTPVSHNRTIIIQTDADCSLMPGYVSAVHDVFLDRPDIFITIGPTWYNIGATVLTNGQEYRNFTGTKKLREYFDECGRDIDDYLLGKRHPVFIGPNTAYRASLFTKYPVRYPEDKRWEQIYLSIELQRQVAAEEIVAYVDGQHVHASARGITHLLGTSPSSRKVTVYSDQNPTWTPKATTEASIREMDQRTYQLSNNQQVEAVVSMSADQTMGDACTIHDNHEVRPARHASTGMKIAGKVTVIGVNAISS